MSDQLNFPVITMPNGKKYHESVEDPQRDFHQCDAKFRWLGGGVGGGKSAAATVEVLRHCWAYPDNYGFILRKSFPELRLSAIKDFYQLCPNWMIVEDNRQEHWVDVYNHVGFKYRQEFYNAMKAKKITKRDYLAGLREIKGTSRVEFISFEGTEAAEKKFRSANIGWYMIEQAEECGDHTIYDRLNERLRRVPSARQAWFISNPDGRDWLWDMFHPDAEGKRINHEMFEFELKDNSNLPDDFHQTLKETYTEEEYARLVEGSFDIATDAVFPEFSFDMHVIPHFEPPEHWDKCLSLDHGLNNPTGAVNIAKLPSGDVYVYFEYYEKNQLVAHHAAALKPTITPEHRVFTIDPTCVNREPISGATVIGEYARAGIPFMPGVKDVVVGINRMKEYMEFDPERIHPFTGEKGSPRFFISDQCPILARQLQRLKWESVKTNRGAQNQHEKVRKFFDHLFDAVRWGIVAFTPHLSQKSYVPKTQPRSPVKAKAHEFLNAEGEHSIEKLIKEASKPPPRNSRAASWR